METRKAIIEFDTPGAQLPSAEVMEPASEFEESVEIRDYIAVILRHKLVILTFLILVFATTLAINLRMTPLFMATGRLEIRPHPPQVTKFQDIEVGASFYVPTEEFMQTQIELLRSYALAERVAKKLQAEQSPMFQTPSVPEPVEGGLFQKIREPLAKLKGTITGWLRTEKETPSQEIPKEDPEKELAGIFLGGLEVSPQKNTNILSLSYVSPDPTVARDAVNTLIGEFTEWQIDRRIEASNAARMQLEKQIEIARNRLEDSETELNRFARQAGIVSLDSKFNLVYRQLEEINQAFSQAETERLTKEVLYQTVQEGNLESLPAVMENAFIQELRSEVLKVEAEYKKLNATFKEEYPALKTLSTQIKDLKGKIRKEEERLAESIKRDYLTTLKKEEALREKAKTQKALVMELNQKAAQYTILEREVETNKQIHQSLVERTKEIEANVGAAEVGNIQVVDYARLPSAPYKPNVRKNLLLAVVVGLMGGIGFAFFLEYLDNTIKRVDEISDRFGIPILGVIPTEESEKTKELYHLVRLKPDCAFSESVRMTQFSIKLSSSMERPPKILLVTSILEGEGKTTLSCNLAQAFASSGERVLIIDGDLRKPRIHKAFPHVAKNNGKGLSHFLTGSCKLNEAIHQSGVNGLYLLFAGPKPPNPVELIASQTMKQTLQVLSKHFDRIIIDSPPFAGFADNLILSSLVDGMILVATLGHTHRQILRTTLKSIYNVRANLLGCIINKLDRSYRYSDYSYRYYDYYKSYSSFDRFHEEEWKAALPQNENETDKPGNENERV